MLRYCLIFCTCFLVISSSAQRRYATSSVLATGDWYKISVKEAGVYKIDLPFLSSLGINTLNLSSNTIRLFGNGGQMLPENCGATVADDLLETAIQVIDGGDGIFNGADYFLFYASGPDIWTKDSLNQRFKHHKNLFSSGAYYFISIGGAGKRMGSLPAAAAPSSKISSFDERYFHELDTINFLNSGKNWYGEEFSKTAGSALTRSFSVPNSINYLREPVTIVSNCIARSVNANSRFQLSVNNAAVLEHSIAGVGQSNQDIFATTSQVTGTFVPSAAMSITYNYSSSAEGSQGWLDWFEIFGRKPLDLTGMNQLSFRDWRSVATSHNGEFNLIGASSVTQVWDITNPLDPLQAKTVLEGNVLKFVNDCSSLKEYIAFNPTGFLTPVIAGKVDNQNLHAAPVADLLIVTFPSIIQEANRLAEYHTTRDKLKVTVVTAAQVFNEFASGSPDPTAIRDFVKMYYDKAGADTTKRPRYLLLFGDASFDYKNRSATNTNYVPAFESANSLDPLASLTSDDYFGFLDDGEDINTASGNLLDIGIGRIPARNQIEARSYIDKLINYTSPKSLGPWKNQLTFIADDEDYNLHLQDAEVITATAKTVNPVFNKRKIYLDAFPEESNSSGSRYPAVNQAISSQVQNGTLIWNYNGHGGFRRLAEEVILDDEIVNSWKNADRLPLFITATCDFAPYDNFTINSLGENILLRPSTGAIALMTTTRLVFAFSNRIMNRNYIEASLRQNADGSYLSLGDAIRKAKNITYQAGGDVINNLKFTLLGDPALTIAYPKYRVRTNSINNIAITAKPDTLKALNQYTVSGSIEDHNGRLLPDFNGTVYITIYDKELAATTLANDPGSLKTDFETQENILFKGKTSVRNGIFTFNFVVPKDIDYKFGNGKISYYADNGTNDANGAFTNFIVGGSQGNIADNQGPVIKALLDSDRFINGGTTGAEPVLLLSLSDSSGINILGTGIGHDISVMIDDDPDRIYKLNDFFEPDLNSHQSGTIRFTLPMLDDGTHTLKIEAWDVVNNSSELLTDFKVVKKKSFSLYRVYNFPNPFNSKTTFRFEHDLDAQEVEVHVTIYNSSGALLKSVKRTINTGGNRSSDIEWDIKNDSGSRIPGGIYIYRLRVTSKNGFEAVKAGKLVVL